MGKSLLRALRAPGYAAWWVYSLVRTNPPVWDLLNRSGKALHKEHPPKLSQEQQDILTGLTENGIAITHLNKILPSSNILAELLEHTQLREKEAKVGVKKTFLKYAWGDLFGDVPIVDLENPFIRLSLEQPVLDVVNSYMNLCSKFIYFELATTNIMGAGATSAGSQRWHRDPGMKKIVKMFIYLTDVDEKSGPFTYILRSQSSGRATKIFPQKQFGRRGIYPPEGAVDKIAPKSDIKVCTGRAGTVIFCDTTGMHKGGYSISRQRTMFTSVYVAEGDVIKPKFKYPGDFEQQLDTLNAVSRFALR